MYMLAGLFYQKFRQTASREGRKYSRSGKPQAIAVLREYVRFPAHAVAARSQGSAWFYSSIDLIKEMLYNPSMDMFVALADPTRRHILEILANSGELAATAIYEQF